MWVIRAYNPDDDELVAEHELGNATLRDLEALLGFAPTQFGSTELDRSGLDRIEMRFGFSIAKDATWFLDFDADPAPVAPEQSPRAAAVA